MYEVDFLPIERTGDLGSKSGDAITMRFSEASGRQRVVVIDGGFSYTGESVVEHLQRWYHTSHIDLMISTHPDQDHINGLASIMELAREGEVTVGELLLHVPHDHVDSALEVSNIEVVDALIGTAAELGVSITEPFTGLTRFNGHIAVLGPTRAYYEELLQAQLAEEAAGVAAQRRASARQSASIMEKATDLLARALPSLPFETLGEDGDSGPRNDSSVVTLLTVDGERMLFTGDAGIEALGRAWDEYERTLGSFPDTPLHFFQAPHHGSRRNLSPSLLNRIFGRPGENLFSTEAFISSALNDKKQALPR
ncbi:ComEC/Rec2 family competence protein [Pedococcus sp. NPDC057267]|uniref:ComEC/Rec2 family competence protein n=1 Tax=Pedococcus sp. NPDC057267 TaxID=3346077 RepID=UPI00363B20EC